jgi:hypothetical protein
MLMIFWLVRVSFTNKWRALGALAHPEEKMKIKANLKAATV